MMESDEDNVFSVLSKAEDLAYSNFFRALLNGFAAFLVLFLIFFPDRELIGVPFFAESLSSASLDVLWASKWLVAFGAALYMLWAFGHLYISWKHLREARYLWTRLDHG